MLGLDFRRSAGTDPSGPITRTGFYGIRSVATWVNTSTGREYMIVLEEGGPGRYFQFDLGLANATTPYVHPPKKPKKVKPGLVRL